MYKSLDAAEETYGKMSLETKDDVKGEISKLEKGLENYGGYKQTIAELAEGLSGDLNQYVQFAAKSRNYLGLEKVIHVIPFMTRKADRMRDSRIRSQSPRENLQMVLNYGEQLVKEICEVRSDAVKTYTKLEANCGIITAKIGEYEPQEAQLKEKKDAMEAAYKAKQDVYQTANAADQAKLVEEMNSMFGGLTQVRNEYDQVFTIYNQAQQALQANIESRNSFEMMQRDLGRQATMIKEKIDNVTEIYMAAPEAVKIMMTTKGMESLDKTINAATDQSVNIITESAGAVSDATLRREEVKLIDEGVMRGYMNRMAETMNDFNKRFDKIRDDANRPQAERYAAKENK